MTINMQQLKEKASEITGPGGFFELEQRVVDGFTYPAYKHASANAIEMIQNARGHGDAECLVYEGRRYSYNQFFELVDAFAGALQAMGVSKGERMAIAMRNNPEWMISFAAGTLLGAIVVPINSWGKTEELEYALRDSGAGYLVCDPARFALVKDSLNALGVAVIVADDASKAVEAEGVSQFSRLLEEGAGKDYQVAEVQPEDDCLIRRNLESPAR